MGEYCIFSFDSEGYGNSLNQMHLKVLDIELRWAKYLEEELIMR